jgi:hypothetical protein
MLHRLHDTAPHYNAMQMEASHANCLGKTAQLGHAADRNAATLDTTIQLLTRHGFEARPSWPVQPLKWEESNESQEDPAR